MDKNRKVGDRIYWEYSDGDGIGSAVIKEVKADTYINAQGKEVPFNDYITYKEHNCISGIEDYNCLAKSNKKRIAYEGQIKAFKEDLSKKMNKEILGEDREPTKAEKAIIDRTIDCILNLNIKEELKEKFNYDC